MVIVIVTKSNPIQIKILIHHSLYAWAYMPHILGPRNLSSDLLMGSYPAAAATLLLRLLTTADE